MNEFFCSVGKALAAYIDVTPNPLLSGEFTIDDGGKTFSVRAICEGDMQRAMAKIEIKKGFGNARSVWIEGFTLSYHLLDAQMID